MSGVDTKKASFATLFSVASVWFGSHAGGGFATGNQATQYYVQYGWFAPIFAVISMAILALVAREAITTTTKSSSKKCGLLIQSLKFSLRFIS